MRLDWLCDQCSTDGTTCPCSTRTNSNLCTVTMKDLGIHAIEEFDNLNASCLLKIDHEGVWSCLDAGLCHMCKESIVTKVSGTSCQQRWEHSWTRCVLSTTTHASDVGCLCRSKLSRWTGYHYACCQSRGELEGACCTLYTRVTIRTCKSGITGAVTAHISAFWSIRIQGAALTRWKIRSTKDCWVWSYQI